MYFNEKDIRKDTASDSNAEYVNLSTVTERIEKIVESKLAFTHDFLDGDLLDREIAEELIHGIKKVVKRLKHDTP